MCFMAKDNPSKHMYSTVKKLIGFYFNKTIGIFVISLNFTEYVLQKQLYDLPLLYLTMRGLYKVHTTVNTMLKSTYNFVSSYLRINV